jgi:hypothetical protein
MKMQRMNKSDIQHNFFESIKNSLPRNLSLADVLSEVLDISTDSAYRRIRGEKMLTIEEIQLLCNHFRISVDEALSLQTNATSFSGHFLDINIFSLDKYLQDMLEQVTYIHNLHNRELIYFCKDVPIFQYFMFPELAAFKFYVWMKTLLPGRPVNGQPDSIDNIMTLLLAYSKKLADLYVQIPGVEILSPGNTATTQWQIEYAHEAKLFKSDVEMEVLYDKLNEMNDHMERQAEAGKKFLPGQPYASGAAYKLYVNDFVIGDNTVLVKSDTAELCFINHNAINVFFTRDKRFIKYTGRFLENVIRKSILISSAGEKERSIFFNHTRRQIDQSRKNLLRSTGE